MLELLPRTVGYLPTCEGCWTNKDKGSLCFLWKDIGIFRERHMWPHLMMGIEGHGAGELFGVASDHSDG